MVAGRNGISLLVFNSTQCVTCSLPSLKRYWVAHSKRNFRTPCTHLSFSIELSNLENKKSASTCTLTKTFMLTQHVEKIIVGKAREINQLTWKKHPISAFLIEHIQVWFTAFCGLFFPVWNSVTIKWWELCTTNSLQF